VYTRQWWRQEIITENPFPPPLIQVKITKMTVAGPFYAQFQYIIEELGKKRNVYPRKILHCSCGRFDGTGKNMLRIKEKIDSRNVTSRFHYTK
jgi:hypothetical protein